MFAGLDLGATSIRAVVATAGGDVRGHARAPTPGGGGVTVASGVVDVLREACLDARTTPTALEGVGVGAIGAWGNSAPASGTVANHDDELPLVEGLAEFVGSRRIVRCNDAVAGVVGERRFTDAPENTVYLTISSGVGAGACVDGNLLSGWRGNAAEMGHVVVDSHGTLECGCGGAGHWEAYAGGENIPGYARHLHDTEDIETALDLDSLDAAAVFAADRRGDPLAETVVERLVRWNTTGVVAIVHAFAPELVSIGGAVALENSERVVDPVRERLPDLLTTETPELRVTPLGEDVVVRGALALALPDAGERP